MKPEDRRINESPLFQGQDEKVAYKLSTTPWGGSPSAVAVVLKLIKTGEDVSASLMEAGAPTVLGDDITTRRLVSLVPNVGYRLEFKWTSAGNIFETFVEIYGQI